MKLPRIPRIPRNRSAISEAVYVILNVALAVVVLAVVVAVKSPLPAFAVVLLSKWRMLAVRPRFWFKNIRSNLVDIIVGLSVVALLYAASGALTVQLAITVLYVGWLLFIKPRSKRHYIAIQSGIATFLGVTALFSFTYDWPASIVILCMWLIGFATARHILSHYHEVERTFFAMIWGLIVAELGWLNYHWTFAYTLPGFSGLELSQTALVVVVLGFLAERVYDSYHRNEGSVERNDVLLPIVFSASIILVILLFFNTIGTGSI